MHSVCRVQELSYKVNDIVVMFFSLHVFLLSQYPTNIYDFENYCILVCQGHQLQNVDFTCEFFITI